MKNRLLKNSFALLLALTYLIAIPLIASGLFGADKNAAFSVGSSASAVEPDPLLYNGPDLDKSTDSPSETGDGGRFIAPEPLPRESKNRPGAKGAAESDADGTPGASAPQAGSVSVNIAAPPATPGAAETDAPAIPAAETAYPPSETASPETEPDNTPSGASESDPDEYPPARTGPASGQEGAGTPGTPPDLGRFVPVAKEYFDTALFIGDSRTVGLREYGGLDNAHYFADVGMSVFSAFSAKVSIPGVGGTGLENLLGTVSYEKIYIMLGINELGYDYGTVVEQYGEVIGKIRGLAPDAIIFVCANLHVSEGRSSKDAIFNNPNIDKLNGDISLLADRNTVFYIDVNPIFDDANGNLYSEYTGDGTHLYAKYYKPWTDWLLTVGVEV